MHKIYIQFDITDLLPSEDVAIDSAVLHIYCHGAYGDENQTVYGTVTDIGDTLDTGDWYNSYIHRWSPNFTENYVDTHHWNGYPVTGTWLNMSIEHYVDPIWKRFTIAIWFTENAEDGDYSTYYGINYTNPAYHPYLTITYRVQPKDFSWTPYPDEMSYHKNITLKVLLLHHREDLAVRYKVIIQRLLTDLKETKKIDDYTLTLFDFKERILSKSYLDTFDVAFIVDSGAFEKYATLDEINELKETSTPLISLKYYNLTGIPAENLGQLEYVFGISFDSSHTGEIILPTSNLTIIWSATSAVPELLRGKSWITNRYYSAINATYISGATQYVRAVVGGQSYPFLVKYKRNWAIQTSVAPRSIPYQIEVFTFMVYFCLNNIFHLSTVPEKAYVNICVDDVDFSSDEYNYLVTLNNWCNTNNASVTLAEYQDNPDDANTAVLNYVKDHDVFEVILHHDAQSLDPTFWNYTYLKANLTKLMNSYATMFGEYPKIFTPHRENITALGIESLRKLGFRAVWGAMYFNDFGWGLGYGSVGITFPFGPTNFPTYEENPTRHKVFMFYRIPYPKKYGDLSGYTDAGYDVQRAQMVLYYGCPYVIFTTHFWNWDNPTDMKNRLDSIITQLNNSINIQFATAEWIIDQVDVPFNLQGFVDTWTMPIFGLAGLLAMFVGVGYGAHLMRKRKYVNGFLYAVVLVATGWALTVAWLWG